MWGFLAPGPAPPGTLPRGMPNMAVAQEPWDGCKLPTLELAPATNRRAPSMSKALPRSSSCSSTCGVQRGGSRGSDGGEMSVRSNVSASPPGGRLLPQAQLSSSLLPAAMSRDAGVAHLSNRSGMAQLARLPVHRVCAKSSRMPMSSPARLRQSSRGSVTKSSVEEHSPRHSPDYCNSASASPNGRQSSAFDAGLRSRSAAASRLAHKNYGSAMQRQHSAAFRSLPSVIDRMTGTAGALLSDKQFQLCLAKQWRNDQEALAAQVSIIRKRQIEQFFNFLYDADEKSLVAGAEQYVPRMLRDVDLLEGEKVCVPARVGTPQTVELPPRQAAALKNLLRTYMEMSSPMQVLINGATAGNAAADCEIIFRPTFCRFLIDTKLVAQSPQDAANGRLPYHRAVNLFDCTSSLVRCVDTGASVNPLLRFCRTATLDQCVTLTGMILKQQQTPAAAIAEFFEEGVPQAQQVMDALMAKSLEASARAATAAGVKDTEQSRRQRQREIMWHNPAAWYTGSVHEWSDGLSWWAKLMDEKCTRSTVSEHCRQHFSLKCYLNDMLIEPECQYVCAAFSCLFQHLYDVYYDEKRTKYDEEGEPMEVPHMSCAAFFRVCVDLSIFPKLCSYEEARSAYFSSECIENPGRKTTALEKLQRCVRRINCIVKALRHWGCEPFSIDKDDLSADEHFESSTGALFVAGREFPRRRSAEVASPAHADTVGQLHLPVNPMMAQVGRRSSVKGSVLASVPPQATQSLPPTDINGREVAQFLWLRDELNSRKSVVAVTGMEHCGSPCASTPPGKRRSAEKSQMTTAGGARQRHAVKWPSAISEVDGEQEAHVNRARRIARFSSATQMENSRKIQRRPSHASSTGTHEGSEAAQETTSHEVPDNEESKLPCSNAKVLVDYRWIRKEFTQMHREEQQAYALLRAFVECTVDRFLCVRDLFLTTGEGGESGILDAAGLMRALVQLNIEHDFSKEALQVFIKLVDPASDGQLATADLEKAANQVREDMLRRWPHALLGQGATADTTSVSVSTYLGKETWRTNEQQCSPRRECAKQPAMIFGCASLIETLLRICIFHMHNSGNPIQVAAPGGMCALWMLSFMRHQFERMLESKQKQHCMTPTASQASTRAATDNSSLESSGPLPTLQGVDVDLQKAASAIMDCPKPEDEPPEGARYVSCSERLLGKREALLQQWALNGICESNLVDSNVALKGHAMSGTGTSHTCSSCQWTRSSTNSGFLFCWACSGVDDMAFTDWDLYPILQRKSLRQSLEAEGIEGSF